MLDKLKYEKGITGSYKRFGTVENKRKGFPNSINNVLDAEHILRTIILDEAIPRLMNELKYLPENKIGDIHVYSDGRSMRFEPTI
jgi:hypothetical protein